MRTIYPSLVFCSFSGIPVAVLEREADTRGKRECLYGIHVVQFGEKGGRGMGRDREK